VDALWSTTLRGKDNGGLPSWAMVDGALKGGGGSLLLGDGDCEDAGDSFNRLM
jgi:hypothetical protein